MKIKIDEASKKNLVFIAKWLAFWILFALIDIFIVDHYFNTTITEAIINNEAYKYASMTVILAYLSGQIEARYMHYKFDRVAEDKHNPHFMFQAIRLISSLPLLSLVDFKVYLCYLAIFPFVHDGAYYVKRNSLNPSIYRKKWFSKPEKHQGMAKSDLILGYPIVRAVLFLEGIITLILLQTVFK